MLKVLKAVDYPMIPGQERWFYVDPNNSYCEFSVPQNAAAVCVQPLLQKFEVNKAYQISDYDRENGWVSVWAGSETGDDVYRMPLYVFARYFDAEAFVRRADPSTEIKYPGFRTLSEEEVNSALFEGDDSIADWVILSPQ